MSLLTMSHSSYSAQTSHSPHPLLYFPHPSLLKILESCLTQQSINPKMSATCSFHVRRIQRPPCTLDWESIKTLILSFSLKRLDHCNSLHCGLPNCALLPLTSVMHLTARGCHGLSGQYYITLDFLSLHWISVSEMYPLVAGTPHL